MDREPPPAPPSVDRGRLEDVPAVAALHAEGLPHEFFVRLGGRFLRAYHQGFVEGPHGVMYVARRGDEVLGFVTGSTRARDHSRWTVRHLGARLTLLGFRGMFLRPRELRAFLRTRLGRYLRGIRRRLWSGRRQAPAAAAGPEPRRGSMAVLHHVVVAPDARGQGLGGELVTAFVEDVRARGARHARLVTLAESGAGELYERLGWSRGRKRVGPDDHLRVEYDLELDGSAPGRRP